MEKLTESDSFSHILNDGNLYLCVLTVKNRKKPVIGDGYHKITLVEIHKSPHGEDMDVFRVVAEGIPDSLFFYRGSFESSIRKRIPLLVRSDSMVGKVSNTMNQLSIQWQPKSDITTFELAECMKVLVGNHPVYKGDDTTKEVWFRHFKIV